MPNEDDTNLLVPLENSVKYFKITQWQKSSREEVMPEYNKNYAILALQYVLKNSKKTISASETGRRYRNNNIENN